VAWRAFVRFQDHHGPDRAAAVAYYTLLSLLPLLAFLISLGSLLLGSFEDAYQGSMLLVRGVVLHLSREAMDALRSFVRHAVRLQWPGLVLLAWTSRGIFASLFSALEVVFGKPGRHFARHNLVAFSMVLVTGVAMLLTMAFTTFRAAGEGLLLRFRASGEVQALGYALDWLLPLAVTFSFFFVVYRFGPKGGTPGSLAALGALAATVLWEAAKGGFAYYVRHVARYSGLYGALEGVIVLAIWLEVSVSIILYCGEVVAVLIASRVAAAPAPAPTVQATASPSTV
jgi:membrane protein